MVKIALAYIPVFGWAFWFGEYIFLKRKLEHDRITLEKGLKALSSYAEPFWVSFFP